MYIAGYFQDLEHGGFGGVNQPFGGPFLPSPSFLSPFFPSLLLPPPLEK